MADSVKVELFEGTDTRNNTRTTLLKRGDRQHLMVAFGECIEDEVRGLLEQAERRQAARQWHFAETPAVLFNDLTKLGEYVLRLKEK